MDCPKPRPSSGAKTQTIWMADKVSQAPIDDLTPYANNNRVHRDKNIAKLKASVKQFGFVTPILVDGDGVIIAGHGRYQAAKSLGLKSVPTVIATHLTDPEVRALRIADNKLAELSDWNEEALQIEFADLMDMSLADDLDFGLEITGFEMPEIDIVIGGSPQTQTSPAEVVEAPDKSKPAVSQPGDTWILGDHRVFCGNSLEVDSYAHLLEGKVPSMVFTDPPYNVPVQGHVRSGSGSGHREFAMASGEMSDAEFRNFLNEVMGQFAHHLTDGGIANVCMDWRHVEELIATGKAAGLDLINLCVWNKTNGGMGSLYRSKHELVCIFKKPGAPHINNVALGIHGRNRTNVWDYAGVNSFGKSRDADLVDHPTVKPTDLVADAIMDVTHRGDVVLDAFGGSGATLLAAEKTGRCARLIELDPLYVDVTIRRWQDMTGHKAVLASTGKRFDELVNQLNAPEGKELAHV